MSIVLNGTTGITNDGGYTGDGVVFADTTPANTLVTTTGGNVGIGTSSPTSPSGFTKVVQVSDASSSTVVVTGGGVSSELGCASGGGWLAANGANPMRFATNGTEAARIDSIGNLLVGTSSSAGSNQKFQSQSGSSGSAVVGRFSGADGAAAAFSSRYESASGGAYHCVWLYNGSVVGVITSNSTTTSYVTSSDYRLKNTVAPMTGALAKVAALKPCTYKWNVDGSDGQGFIAHELAEVVPDAVTGEKDAVETYTDEDGNEQTRPKYQGIDTSFLVATLTAAIQEQQAIITEQDVKMGQLVDQLTNAESTMNLLTEMFTESQQTVAALTARVEALEGTQP